MRLRSLATCEVCGSPGRLRLSGFAKTVCEKHVGVLGELRDDDGRWADPWTWNDASSVVEDLLDKGRALISECPAASAELLGDMDPVRPRPKDHVMDEMDEGNDPFRETALGKRFDDDYMGFTGRENELLLEFGWHIQDAVQGACVKEEYLDKYIEDEIEAWREFAVQPLSDADREFLHGYLQALILEEYERIRIKQAAERADRNE